MGSFSPMMCRLGVAKGAWSSRARSRARAAKPAMTITNFIGGIPCRLPECQADAAANQQQRKAGSKGWPAKFSSCCLDLSFTQVRGSHLQVAQTAGQKVMHVCACQCIQQGDAFVHADGSRLQRVASTSRRESCCSAIRTVEIAPPCRSHGACHKVGSRPVFDLFLTCF